MLRAIKVALVDVAVLTAPPGVSDSGAPQVHLQDVWSLGLRMTFTWRRYW